MGRWACYGSLIFKEREASAAHLFQCWATGLNGIKTHCERGRNWAIHVFSGISFRSKVRESWVKPRSTGGVSWPPDFAVTLRLFPSLVTIYGKPEEGGKSAPVNSWMLLNASLVFYKPHWQVFSPNLISSMWNKLISIGNRLKYSPCSHSSFKETDLKKKAKIEAIEAKISQPWHGSKTLDTTFPIMPQDSFF